MRWPPGFKKRRTSSRAASLPRLRGWGLGSRVGRRFLLLFLLAAGLPIALMSLLSSQAVDVVVQRSAAELRSERLRSVATGVLARLMTARTLMQAWPEGGAPRVDPQAEPSPQGLADRLAGLGGVFVRAALLSADHRVLWASDAPARDWAELQLEAVPPARQFMQADVERLQFVGGARIRELPPTGDAAAGRVLMSLPVASADGRYWVAELAQIGRAHV
jgi:hypothetical protein